MSSFFEAYFGGPLNVGSAAPDFEAEDETGKSVKLSALRGTPVVLVFYPGDDTPGCTRQLCEFRDRWSACRDAGAAVFGVNPQGAASHTKFAAKFGFPFPILVDRGGRIASQYRSGGRLVRRTVYAIGADGRVAFAQRGMPAPELVLSALRSANGR
ncbi:MAG: peroxiredoxin [Bryobacteraceae bacterium]|nr:peroxiredoxin [Bryobacteraceae bacterium]